MIHSIRRLCYTIHPHHHQSLFPTPPNARIVTTSRKINNITQNRVKTITTLNKYVPRSCTQPMPYHYLSANEPSLHKNTKVLAQCARNYSATSPEKDEGQRKKTVPRVPRLILVPNPLIWLITKFDFVVLRSVWDPTFEEKQFKIGTKQAISRVTTLVSEGRYADLSGLLTRQARTALLKDLERSWPEQQRKQMALTTEDIQISSPRKVYFIKVAEKKYCAVDMAFLSLKWVSPRRSDGLLFSEIFARFHREYTPACIPEWTIAYFKFTRFHVLRKKIK